MWSLNFSVQTKCLILFFAVRQKRAQDTCKIFLNGARKPNLKPEIKEALYDFSGSSVIEFIKKLPNHLNKVLLFGHNYAFTHIANTYGHLHLSNLPTSGLVVINFDIMDWNDLKKGKTQSIIIPKTLRNG
jgi:phosphohistidine phosphatase